MPLFREDHYLVIAPGSRTTLAQLGLHESLTPPSIEVATKVYRHPDHLDNDKYFKSTGDEASAIYPIVKGKIVNVDALNYLIKLIFKSSTKKFSVTPYTPLLLVSDSRWSRVNIEKITQYVFETLNIPAFTVVPNSLCASFAYGLQSCTCIVDIGFEKTEITPIVEFCPVEHATITINYGGSSINKSLSKLLPNLDPETIDELKKSEIYEILNSIDAAKNSFLFANHPPEDEGIIDVAAIVTSGNTREILEQREKEKKQGKKEAPKPNAERETSEFTDSKGNTFTIGKERFKGAEDLLERIADATFRSLSKVDEIVKRANCWDGIILVGRGASIKGFKEAFYTLLEEKYLVSRTNTYSEVPSSFTSGQNTPRNGTPFRMNQIPQPLSHGQSPTSIKLGKMPDYFTEWKHYGYSNASFLGAQIASKQIFGGHANGSYVSRNDYNEVGPLAIWDI